MSINLFVKCVRTTCMNQTLLKHLDFETVKLYRCLSHLSNDLTSTNGNRLKISNYGDSGPSTIIKGNNRRWYSSMEKLPPLMDFPEIVWPSLMKSIRNFILSTFIIKPYFDNEFNLPDFVTGSKKALEVVSNKIADGDFKTLDGLVTQEIVPTLQKSISTMSLSQREHLAVNSEDIYFSFPYQVGVMFKEQGGKAEQRFVEVTMVYHTLKGLAAMRNRGEEPPLNMGMMPEYQRRISICNYRFIREFTKGVDGDWTINLLNHFRPSDQGE